MRTQRRSRVRVFAAALTTVIAAGAMAGPAAADGPRDSVVGAGTVGDDEQFTGEQHVAFAAFGDTRLLAPPFDADPVTGHFLARGDILGRPFQQEGPVTCLVVDGRTARLVYPVKQATPDTNEGADVLISIFDGGRPRGGESPDRISFALFDDETPDQDPPTEQDAQCLVPVPATSRLTQGDFTVRDIAEP